MAPPGAIRIGHEVSRVSPTGSPTHFSEEAFGEGIENEQMRGHGTLLSRMSAM
jgi:hypothetical protein